MTDAMSCVRAFHRQFELPIREQIGLPGKEERELRIRLLTEEFNEYLAGEAKDDIVEIADGLADMVYIICGTALAYGIPLDRVFNEVQRSNMSKLGADGKPVRREDGKVLKGPNFFRPNIRKVLGVGGS